MEGLTFTGFSVGANAYRDVGKICSTAGINAVIIGSSSSLEAAADKLAAQCEPIVISGKINFSGAVTEKNAEELSQLEPVKFADMIFALGGGKIIDICKIVSSITEKPLYSFPTVASCCACSTGLAVSLVADGEVKYLALSSPIHAFIDTSVLAQTPVEYLRTGIARALALDIEAQIRSRLQKNMSSDYMTGLAAAQNCVGPLLRTGADACYDNSHKRDSEVFGECVKTVTASAGNVQTLLLEHSDNASLVLGMSNAVADVLEANIDGYCRGDFLAIGILITLYYDGQAREAETLKKFFNTVGLPSAIQDLGLVLSDMDIYCQMISQDPCLENYYYKKIPPEYLLNTLRYIDRDLYRW